MYPEELKYHKAHTWARIKGNRAVIGITDFAQKELGDIVYLDLPEVDSTVEAGSVMTDIESTKATDSVVAPVSGTVVEVNEDLSDTPEVINEDPYDKGWIAVIEMSSASEVDDLLDAEDYTKFIEEESK